MMQSPKSTPVQRALLQLYRAGVLVLIAWVVREHRVRLQIENDAPVALAEVKTFLPDAARMTRDPERFGLDVLAQSGARIGYAIRTMPQCKDIKGYVGPSDTLIVFDEKWIVRGVSLRKSPDTFAHIHDVVNDPYYLKSWQGKSWDELAGMDLKRAGVEGVSGATLTSMGMAQAMVARLKRVKESESAPQPLTVRLADWGVFATLLGALLIAFSGLRGVRWLRAVWQVALVAGVGLLNGQLLAVALFSGWMASGVTWRMSPGIALLGAAALLVPWSTRQPLYCQYICPHGAAQEWLHRFAPKFLRVNLPHGISAGLRWLPGLLLLLALGATLLVLPMDLADIEPFDAYLLRASGWASIVVALLGLLASIFVPMAFCKFGCPTGALLEFVRARGPGERFGKRDWAGLVLLGFALWIFWDYERVRGWIDGI